VQLTRLRLDGLGAPLVCRQLLVSHPPFVQTLRLVYGDRARAEHLTADVAVHRGRRLHRAAAVRVLLLLLTSLNFSLLHVIQ
jgi:hypothetical protein